MSVANRYDISVAGRYDISVANRYIIGGLGPRHLIICMPIQFCTLMLTEVFAPSRSTVQR